MTPAELIAQGESARVEFKGSGVRRVIDAFIAYGLPEPEFEATQGGMAVTVFMGTNKAASPQQPMSTAAHAATPSDMSGKMSGKITEKVINALKSDPSSTIPALAAQLGVATRTVDRALKQLQQDGRVARIGQTKGSHWEVIAES